MKKKLKVSIFTGNRAEYGLLSPIIKKISQSNKIDENVIISGSHLNKNYGFTSKEIFNDKIKKVHKLKVKLRKNNLVEFTPLSISEIISKLTVLIKKLKPEVFIIYADRYETFAAAIAATQMGIPTIHLEGGDVTEGGTFDDNVRHAITKLSHFHITTNLSAKKRIIKMGEEPWRVKNFGYPVIDLIREGNYASPNEISKKLNISLKKPIIVFTLHPIPIEEENFDKNIINCFNALEKISSKEVDIIITNPNSDKGGDKILNYIKKKKNKKNFKVYDSLGRYYYHGLFSLIKKKKLPVACVGNSSSGIKETAIFGCPVVNIGKRQNGRLRSNNVIDVEYKSKKISTAITKCLFDRKFQKICINSKNVYGGGDTATKVVNFLENTNFKKRKILIKLFK